MRALKVVFITLSLLVLLALSAGALAQAPYSTFKVNTNAGAPGMSVTFTDTSANSPTSWAWNFGDGTANATTQNCIHSYASIGTYTATLTASNADGTNNTYSMQIYVVDWLSGWNYMKMHNVTTSQTLTNHNGINVTLYAGVGTDAGSGIFLNNHAKADYSDVRFTTIGDVLIPFTLAYSNATSATFFLQTNTTANVAFAIKIYYGNTFATSAALSPLSILDGCDNFSTNTIGTYWTEANTFSGGGSWPGTHAIVLGTGYHIVSSGDHAAQIKLTNGMSRNTTQQVAIVLNSVTGRSPPWWFFGAGDTNYVQCGYWGGVITYNFPSMTGTYMFTWNDATVANSMLITNSAGQQLYLGGGNLGSDHKSFFGSRTGGSENEDIYYMNFVAYNYTNATITHGATTSEFSLSTSFIANPVHGNVPLTVQFNDTGTVANPVAWYWTFGDGNTSILNNPTNIYQVSGIYTVAFTEYNTSGSASYSMAINISQDFDYTFLPGWSYEKIHGVVSSQTLANHNGINVTLYAGSGTDVGSAIFLNNHAKANYSDIRFTTLTNQPIPFTLAYNNSTSATFYLQTNMTANIAFYYKIFYGNATATSIALPPLSILDGCDNFSTNTIGTYWTEGYTFSGGGAYATTHGIQNGGYRIQGAGDRDAQIKLTNAMSRNTTQQVTILVSSISGRSPPWWEFGFGDVNLYQMGYWNYVINYNIASPTTSKFVWNDATTSNNVQVFDINGNLVLSSGYDPGADHKPFFGARYAGSETGDVYYMNFVAYNYTGATITQWPTTSEATVNTSFVSFTANVTTGASPLCVGFTDTSNMSSPTSWYWDFGDGTSSTSQNPSHIYTSGTYSVTLRVTNATAMGNLTKVNYIYVLTPCTANFTMPITQVNTSTAASFNDTSVGGPGGAVTGWQWNFGDGTANATTNNPTHTFALPGTYNVTLTATNAYGYSSVVKQIVVNPVVNGNFETGDASYWTLASSTVSATYVHNGTYGVGLTTSTNTSAITQSINFTYMKNITFWAKSPGSAVTFYVMIDGSPFYVNSVGTTWTQFMVDMSLSNFSGNHIFQLLAYNGAAGPLYVDDILGSYNTNTSASFKSDTLQTNVTQQVTFNDTSYGLPTAWAWQFGDGTANVTTQNATHLYTSVGTYLVNLTVSNTQGSTTTQKTVIVSNSSIINGNFENGGSNYWTLVAGSVSPAYMHNTGYGVGLTTSTNASSITQSINLTFAKNITLWAYGSGSIFYILIDNTPYYYTSATSAWAQYTYDLSTFNMSGGHKLQILSYNGAGVNLWLDDINTSYDTKAQASFTADTLQTNFTQQVTFNDTSYGLPTAWAWQFGDGSANVTTQNATHLYTSAGTYLVNLTVTNAQGSSTTQKTVVVSMSSIINGNFENGGSNYWTLVGGAVGATYVHNGTYGVGLTTSTNTSSITQSINFTYIRNVTLWAKGNGGTSTFYIIVDSSSYYRVDAGSSWAQYSFDFTPFNMTGGHKFQVLSYNGAGVNLYVDDIVASYDTKPQAYFITYPATTNLVQPMQFNDTSYSFPTAWQWNYGDGTANDTIRNPTHKFANYGTYNVTLTVTNPSGSSSVQKSVSVIPILNGNFEMGNLTYWTVVAGSPVASSSYAHAGVYSCYFPASQAASISQVVNLTYVKNITACSYGAATFYIQIDGVTLGNFQSSVWGVGTVDLSTLNYSGNHTLTIGVTSQVGNVVYVDDVIANYVTTPQASFTVDTYVINTTQPLSVNDTSYGYPTAWAWQWGDGTANATTNNATHVYTTPGTYILNLTVITPTGAASTQKTITVGYNQVVNGNFETGNLNYWRIVAGSPVASSSYAHAGVYSCYFPAGQAASISQVVNLTYVKNITACSYGAATFYIQIDGVTLGSFQSSVWGVGTVDLSTLTYSGNHILTVGVTSQVGNVVYVDDVIDNYVTAPQASFNVDTFQTNLSQPITVNDTSYGYPTAWQWQWGDGSTNSTTQNASHVYPNTGTYVINLTVTTPTGIASTQKTVTAGYNQIVNGNFETGNFNYWATSGAPTVSSAASYSAPYSAYFAQSAVRSMSQVINLTNIKTITWWDYGALSYTLQIDGVTKGSYTASSWAQRSLDISASNYVDNHTLSIVTSSSANVVYIDDMKTIQPVPVANFTSNVTNGTSPLCVQFWDNTTNIPTSWQWNFGDGTPNSTVQNPVHTYVNMSSSGNFTVTLTVTNTGGTSATTKTIGGVVDTFQCYKDHVINGSIDGAQTPYVVRLNLYNTAGSDNSNNIYLNGNSLNFPNDIRFGDINNNPDYYWIESNTSNSAIVWVRIPTIPASPGNVTVRVRYGNQAITVNVSDGPHTFLLFDHMDAWNSSMWGSGANYVYNNSIVTITTKDLTNDFFDTVAAFGPNVSVRTKEWTYSANDGSTNEKMIFGWSTPFMYAMYSDASNKYKYENYINSPSYASITGVSAQTWFIQTANWTKSLNMTWTVNDAYSTSVNTYVPSGALNVGWCVATNPSSMKVDWIFIRNYTLHEPNSTSTGPEVNTGGPTANFTANITAGLMPLTVQFWDNSTGAPTAWAWQWGDGTANDTTQNPTHTYTNAGTYTVNLTASNANGTSTFQRAAYINVAATTIPSANFTANVTKGLTPLCVQFWDNSTGYQTTWAWQWGDGTANDTTQNPTHTYTNAGTYTVNLTASNANGTNTFQRAAYIVAVAPTIPSVSFHANVSSGISPLCVGFTDDSTGYPSAWQWSWGDATANDTTQNPTHTYNSAGAFTVTLTASNANGTNTFQQVGYINVVIPVVEFNVTSTVVNENVGSVSLTITKNANVTVNSSTSINYTTVDGNATAGVYYTTTSGTVTFLASEQSKTIQVPITNIAGYNPNTFFFVNLSNPVNGTIGANSTTTVQIVNIDALPTFQFNVSSISVNETGGTVTINVTKTGSSAVNSTVNYTTQDGNATAGQNYTATSGQLLFQTNDVNTPIGNRFSNPGFETGDTSSWSGGGIFVMAALTHTGAYCGWIDAGSIAQQTINLSNVDAISIWDRSYGAAGSGYDYDFRIDGVVIASVHNAGSQSYNYRTWDITSYHYTGNHVVSFRDTGSSRIQIDDANTNGNTTVSSIFKTFTIPITNTAGYNNDTFFFVNLSLPTNASLGTPATETVTICNVDPVPIVPTSNFTANVTLGVAPLCVGFTDSSTGYPTAWQWQWGDGTANGTTQNPAHIYSSAGTYTVNLTASNVNGTGTTFQRSAYITTIAPILPTTNFSANVTSGVSPLGVKFTDNSSGLTISTGFINGNFENGMTGWNTNGGAGYTGTSTIYVHGGSYSAFIFNNNLFISQTIDFTNLNNISIWLLGDNPASFSVVVDNSSITLDMGNAWKGWVQHTYNVGGLGLSGNHTFMVYCGFGCLYFDDLVANYGGVSGGWQWDFGDATFGSANSTVQNPAHTYSNPGTYTVTLTTANANGTNTMQKTNYITAIAPTIPSANFTSNVTSGVTPVCVQFWDNSTGYQTAWAWQWGDGTANGTTQNPTHTYTNAGTYTVNLTASNANGTNTFQRAAYIVTIAPTPPATAFHADKTSGLTPLSVQFTDDTTGAPASWQWDFGDVAFGTANSTTQSPTHTYSSAGLYTVTLTTANTNGSSTTQKIGYIRVDTILVANFTTNVTRGPVSLDIQAWDNSSGYAPSGWQWNWGDGSSNDTVQNPTHIYTHNGTYSITLTVSNIYGSDTKQRQITVTDPTPITNFNAVPVLGILPLDGSGMNVSFIDLSNNWPVVWSWDFGDGNTSGVQNPYHVYYTPGIYTVTLNASNENGYNITTKTNYVNVVEPFITGINFNANTTKDYTPMAVQFNDLCANDTVWQWNFGDGTANSTVRNPVHLYTSTGLYTVTLTASNLWDSRVITRTNYINVTRWSPVASFTTNTTSGDSPLCVQFNDTSINATAWSWNFGDGNTSTLQNPVHTYYTNGRYTATLTALNYNGANTSSVAINVDPASFTANVTRGYVSFAVLFNDTSLNAIAWQWNFGDGTTNATTQNVTHVYDTPGTYNVTLTITTDDGSYSLGKPNYIVALAKPVNVNFNANHVKGPIPFDVAFTDLSTNATSWSWNFGDGNTSTTRNLTHTYYTPGIYTVTLNASNQWANGTYTITNYINVTLPSPTADFTANDTVGDAPMAVQFNYTGTWATEWHWDFGDGNFSTDENPINIYNTLGIYTVKLTVLNSGGQATVTNTNMIAVNSPNPVANFSASPLAIIAGGSTQFTDLSTKNPTSWQWNFGDGTANATTKNPSHRYSEPGNYTVMLTVANGFGSDSVSVQDYITVIAPIAKSGIVPPVTVGKAPLYVLFWTSTQNATVWSWDFGDGSTANGNGNGYGVGHTFQQPGTYTVTLTASNEWNSDNATVTITVLVPIVAVNWTSNATSGFAPLTIAFTANSTNATAWSWNFGDGNTSTQQNPIYTYDTPGTYTVTLNASNPWDSQVQTRTDYIVVSSILPPTPIANFTQSALFGYAPLLVTFHDLSTGSPTYWLWTFGDGDTSTVRNATHSYEPGTYTVRLYTSNQYGNDTMTKTITVLPTLPTADFIGVPTSSPTYPAVVLFSDLSSNATAWQWNFGDGIRNSTVESPSHQFMYPGDYNVTLTVTNKYGVSTMKKLAYIHIAGPLFPVSIFEADPYTGYAPLTVNFTDESLNNPTYWNWTFGDGQFSAAQNPTHIYNLPGTYNVTLYVSNALGNTSSTETITVSVLAPIADFAASPTNGTAPLQVQFTDISTGYPTGWAWDFGEGTNSTEQSPSHTYSAEGNYTVSLTVTNGVGSNTTIKTDYIVVGAGETYPLPEAGTGFITDRLAMLLFLLSIIALLYAERRGDAFSIFWSLFAGVSNGVLALKFLNGGVLETTVFKPIYSPEMAFIALFLGGYAFISFIAYAYGAIVQLSEAGDADDDS